MWRVAAVRRSIPFALALAVALSLAVHDADAVSTRTWSTSTYRDFDEGEAERALITSLGEVMPGFKTDRVDLETDAVWTAVRAGDGTIYAGGISDGNVYAVSGGKKRVVVTLEKETPWIGALALGPGEGTLYAGTLGSARVHAIDLKTGKSSALATLEGVEHVWSLVVDPQGKKLYAGTGPDGKLFEIDLGGGAKPKMVWESGEKHLLSMIRASDGALWIGTSDEAVLYRFDPKSGQARAIADFAGTEVKSIVEVDGAFIVAANEFDQKPSTPPAPPAAKGPKGTAAKPPEGGSGPGADKKPELPRPGERKGKGGLFRVEPDGRVEQLHALGDGYFTDLAAVSDGSVYAGAGTQGRVYQVKADRTVITVFDTTERQVNAIMTWDGGVAFLTGDGAAAYTSAGPAKDATYTSKVFDAAFPARWGNLRWRGAGVTVETRSGNTAKPGKGWSAWQKLGKPAKAPGDSMVGRIASPTGRFVQYRVQFAGAGSVLRDVVVYYLPQNQRPRVTEITVGAESGKTPVTTQEGPAKPRSPILKAKWKVEGGDDDELVYELQVRAEGDVDWRDVPTGDAPLTKTEFDWNTEALPDGWYRLRVAVSDAKGNPPDVALEHAHVGTPFLVDNQKPQVAGLEVKLPWASGRAVDTFSRIDEIAYQIDGGDWVVAFPKDGIFDDVSEAFTIKLPADLKPGAHTLSIRVADEADNIGASSVSFRVGK
jgi:outer membrane protein assembly factor BamB